MNKSYQKKMDIAQRLRETAVKNYKRVCPDGDDDLACMCAIVSYSLAKAFKKVGFKAKVIEGTFYNNSHCWVVSGNKRWDLTATQFRRSNTPYPEIFITNLSEKKGIYSKGIVKKSFRDWPTSQRPTKSRNLLLLRSMK